jgi:hypothetical protein
METNTQNGQNLDSFGHSAAAVSSKASHPFLSKTHLGIVMLSLVLAAIVLSVCNGTTVAPHSTFHPDHFPARVSH